MIFVVDPRDIDDLRDAIVPLMPSEGQAASSVPWSQPPRRYEDRLRAAGGEAAVTFHAVSALGRPPAEIESGAARVRPVNCLDPLAAVLSQI